MYPRILLCIHPSPIVPEPFPFRQPCLPPTSTVSTLAIISTYRCFTFLIRPSPFISRIPARHYGSSIGIITKIIIEISTKTAHWDIFWIFTRLGKMLVFNFHTYTWMFVSDGNGWAFDVGAGIGSELENPFPFSESYDCKFSKFEMNCTVPALDHIMRFLHDNGGSENDGVCWKRLGFWSCFFLSDAVGTRLSTNFYIMQSDYRCIDNLFPDSVHQHGANPSSGRRSASELASLGLPGSPVQWRQR